MPFYVFKCNACNLVYEELTSYDPKGKYTKIKCPECKSRKKEQLPTSCSFNFSNPVGTSRWINSTSGHDYRYKHNQPNVRKEREMAEVKSHMGTTDDIYRQIDDVSSGKNEDFSKI